MIVLPSRGRPESLRRFFDISQPIERGVVMLDQDDAKHYDGVPFPDHWSCLIGPRIGYVAMMNQAFRLYPHEPWYACWGDDVMCRRGQIGPLSWSTQLARMAGSDGVAYGDDLINGEKKSCLPFIGGDLVRKVGWLSCPPLHHLYCDQVWYEIGDALGVLRYVPEIITEHLHWSTGKQPFDQTAAERNTDHDDAAFIFFMAKEFHDVVHRCKA